MARFWILDFGFWIAAAHGRGAGHALPNPKSKIQNPKSCLLCHKGGELTELVPDAFEPRTAQLMTAEEDFLKSDHRTLDDFLQHGLSTQVAKILTVGLSLR